MCQCLFERIYYFSRLIILRRVAPIVSTGCAASTRRVAKNLARVACAVFGSPFAGKFAALDFAENLLHFLAGVNQKLRSSLAGVRLLQVLKIF